MGKTFKIGNKYIGFVYGKEWDKEDLKLLYLMKNNLGWTLQIWRFSIYYDNWNKAKGFRGKIKK